MVRSANSPLKGQAAVGSATKGEQLLGGHIRSKRSHVTGASPVRGRDRAARSPHGPGGSTRSAVVSARVGWLAKTCG
jgi:hypothetical protein